MLKINIIFSFYIASGLAGVWLPQNNDQRQFGPIIPEQSPLLPQAKPCRRRNYGGEIGAVLTDAGWVPLPARDQQTRSQPIQSPLKPQSLTEIRVPATDDTKEDPKLVEYVENSSLPNQNSRKSYIDENENESPIPDKAFNDQDIDKYDQDAAALMAKSAHPEHTSLEQVDSHEISHECLRHVNPDHDLKHEHSERQSAVKTVPKKTQERAHTILPECAQASRRSMQDPESDSRKLKSSRLNEVDKTDGEISSKLESNDEMKSGWTPNDSIMKPYLLNPARNAGKWQSDSRVSLMENGRVCYACSTFYDPSCWTVNATTTVKYCSKENNACVSKMYKIDGKVILIRDCGHTCNDREDIHMGQKITSCSICHHDLCNGASFHGISALLVMLIISVIKFTS